jgi:hypothetical protein
MVSAEFSKSTRAAALPATSRVRLTPKSGHVQCASACLLWARSGRGFTSFSHEKPEAKSASFELALINNRYCLHCLQVVRGACFCSMVDDSHQHAENATAILRAAYCRGGVDVAIQAAIHMISIAAALLTSESGPDESRRILQIVGEAQGKAS